MASEESQEMMAAYELSRGREEAGQGRGEGRVMGERETRRGGG
jgi:hypothetical protein